MNVARWSLTGLLLLALIVALTLPALAADPQDVYTQGGANPAAMACVTCHGTDAEGLPAAGFPRLGGLPAEYMKKQLGDYRSGARANPVMQPIAAALSAEEVDAVTRMLASKPWPKAESVGRDAAAQGIGETLALRGAWERNIPECVACHGPGGAGVGNAFPPLVGQSAQYLSSQLNAWRQGTRKNDPQDLMGHIARSMTEAEVQAVSVYFAGLTATGAAQ